MTRKDWTFDLETAVATWRQFLSRDRAFHDGDLDELEVHLRDEYAAACARGMSGHEAFQEARRLTGEPGGLNESYSSVVLEKRLAPTGVRHELRYLGGLAHSYAISAIRALRRSPTTSFINIFGLSIAVACSITVFLFLQIYGTLDSFHENGDRIFMVEHRVVRNGQTEIRGTVPTPLGPAVAAEVPEVAMAVRVDRHMVRITAQDISLEERATFADPGYLDMLTFPLRFGSADVLRDPSSAILSYDTAFRLFGTADVVGEQVTMAFGDGERREFIVGGVTEDFPENAGFYFGVLLGWDALGAVFPNMDQGWGTLSRGLFVMLHQADQAEAVVTALQRYVPQQNASNEDYLVESFLLDNLRDPMPGAHNVINRPSEAPHPMLMGMFVIIAALMMALSCFNYINISVGAALRRLREIGVRKVMGGTRAQLTTQFMVENLLLCAGALVLGTVLAVTIAIPAFNGLFPITIGIGMFTSVSFWTFMVVLLTSVAVLSGLYPALYISSFRPVSVLGGRLSFSGNAWFTRAFLTAQFTLAFMTILAVVLITANGRYMRSIEWGFGAGDVVVVPVIDAEQHQDVMRTLSSDARVSTVSAADSHPGRSLQNVQLTVEGQQILVVRYVVGDDYMQALNLADRSLTTATVFVNRSFETRMGWETAVGRRLLVGDTYYDIAAVIPDFHINPILKGRPVLVMHADVSDAMPWIAARTEAGAATAVLSDLQERWEASWPSEPFAGVIQSEVFHEQLESYDNMARSIGYLGFLAVLIATMGLFGLTSQNVSRRLKEVCVRKVLGASAGSTLLSISWGYVWMLLIASAIAVIVVGGGAALIYSTAPAEFEPMPLTPLPFIIGVTAVWIVAAIAMAVHVGRLSKANPAEVLRIA